MELSEEFSLNDDDIIRTILAGNMPTLKVETLLGEFVIKSSAPSDFLERSAYKQTMMETHHLEETKLASIDLLQLDNLAALKTSLVKSPSQQDILALPMEISNKLFRGLLFLDKRVAQALNTRKPPSDAERASLKAGDGAPALAAQPATEPHRAVTTEY